MLHQNEQNFQRMGGGGGVGIVGRTGGIAGRGTWIIGVGRITGVAGGGTTEAGGFAEVEGIAGRKYKL